MSNMKTPQKNRFLTHIGSAIEPISPKQFLAFGEWISSQTLKPGAERTRFQFPQTTVSNFNEPLNRILRRPEEHTPMFLKKANHTRNPGCCNGGGDGDEKSKQGSSHM